MAKATAVVFRHANRPMLEDLTVPEPRPREVLIRTHFSGISIGTEQSIFSGVRTHNGTFPLATGYMSSGVVEAVGSEVVEVAVGDCVAAASGARFEGEVKSVWGAHVSRRVAPADKVYKLPPRLPLHDAAMFVLPSVGLNAVTMLAPGPDDTIVVQGQGLIGQFFGQFARQRGCRVIVIEPDARRAALAQRYVTPHVLNPLDTNLAAAVGQLTAGRGAPIIVEATGNKQLIRQASSLLRPHSRMVFLGWYPQDITVEYQHFHANSVTALFPMGNGGPEVARKVLDALADGSVIIGDNITDIVPWAQAPGGFERIIAGDRGVMGMVIDWRQA